MKRLLAPIEERRRDGDGCASLLCTPLRRLSDTVPLVLVQLQAMELPATTVGETPLPVKTQGRHHELPFSFDHRVLLQNVVFQVSLRKVQQGPGVTTVVTGPGTRNGALC